MCVFSGNVWIVYLIKNMNVQLFGKAVWIK